MNNDILRKPPFQYKTAPFKHQRDHVANVACREYYAIFWEMGSGKSKALLDEAAVLYIGGGINGLLIIAPKGAYLNWVFNEIPKHISDSVDYYLGYWRSGAKKAERKAQESVMTPEEGALDILVMNVEALSSRRGFKVADDFVSAHQCMVCIDESTSIKSPKAKRTKACINIGKHAEYRRIMSGYPVTHSPLDLYSQCEFLEHGLLGHTSFYSYKNYHANIITVRMGTRTFPKITGYRNLEELKGRLAKFSSRITKEECLDLPDKIFTRIYAEMSAEQWRAYDSMREMCIVEFQSEIVTVTSALTALVKLQQIACGHIKTEDGVTLDIPNSRIPLLMETIEEIDGKIIIWCNFIRDVELVQAHLKDCYGTSTVETYYGETSPIDRVIACERFNEDESCRFFVATSAASKGLTLTACNYNIYYSHSYNLENFMQSQDRTHRIGQTRNVQYISIVAPGTVDEKILRALEEKKNIGDYILADWSDIF